MDHLVICGSADLIDALTGGKPLFRWKHTGLVSHYFIMVLNSDAGRLFSQTRRYRHIFVTAHSDNGGKEKVERNHGIRKRRCKTGPYRDEWNGARKSQSERDVSVMWSGLPFSYRQVRHYDLKGVGRGRKGQINQINTKQNGNPPTKKDNIKKKRGKKTKKAW